MNSVLSARLLAISLLTFLGINSATIPAQELNLRLEQSKIIRNVLPGLNLVRIEAGTFQMGSSYAENVACKDGTPPKGLEIVENEIESYCKEKGPAKWFQDESPRHTVIISRDFLMSDSEITVSQFRQFIDDTNYVTVAERLGKSLGEDNTLSDLEVFGVAKRNWNAPWKDAGDIDDHPVVHVAWEDAVAFCLWVSEVSGQNVRLPTEAEWEFAAKAGQTKHVNGVFAWGAEPPKDEPLGNLADHSFKEKYPKWKYPVLEEHDDGYSRTAPVRSFAPNAWGLYDMSGNVWEWTSDTYLENAYKRRTKLQAITDPFHSIKAEGFFHTMRGGSYDFEIPFLRVEKRRTLYPVWKQHQVFSSASVGFRIAVSLNETKE